MHKIHLTGVALLLAAAAVLGAIAVARTTGLGSSARHANDAAVAAKTQQLANYAAQLRKALAAQPPALPKAAPPAIRRVVYRQPAPIVVTVHRHHADDGGFEAEGGGGGDG